MSAKSKAVARRYGLKEIDVHFGTFDYTFYCVAGPYTDLPKYVAWRMDDPNFASGDPKSELARGRTFTRKNYCPVLWIPGRPRTAEAHGTLAHEVLHIVRGMLVDWVGMELTHDSDEAFCHALGFGVRTIMRAL